MGRDGARGGTITSAKMEMGHPQQQGGDPKELGKPLQAGSPLPAGWAAGHSGGERGGIAGEQLSREWGARRGPTEAHCTQGDASKGGRDKRVCAEEVREGGNGNEGTGPTRGESGGPGEAGAARGGSRVLGGGNPASCGHLGDTGEEGKHGGLPRARPHPRGARSRREGCGGW